MAPVLISPTAEKSSQVYPSSGGCAGASGRLVARGGEPRAFSGLDLHELGGRVGASAIEPDFALRADETNRIRNRCSSFDSLILTIGKGAQMREGTDKKTETFSNNSDSRQRLMTRSLSHNVMNRRAGGAELRSKQLNENVLESVTDGPRPVHSRLPFGESHRSNPSLNTPQATPSTVPSNNDKSWFKRVLNPIRMRSSSTSNDTPLSTSTSPMPTRPITTIILGVSPLVRDSEQYSHLSASPSKNELVASRSSVSLCSSENQQFSSLPSIPKSFGPLKLLQTRETPRIPTNTRMRPLPVDADIIEIYSTTPGCVSFRNRNEGVLTYRIEFLCMNQCKSN